MHWEVSHCCVSRTSQEPQTCYVISTQQGLGIELCGLKVLLIMCRGLGLFAKLVEAGQWKQFLCGYLCTGEPLALDHLIILQMVTTTLATL